MHRKVNTKIKHNCNLRLVLIGLLGTKPSELLISAVLIAIAVIVAFKLSIFPLSMIVVLATFYEGKNAKKHIPTPNHGSIFWIFLKRRCKKILT